MNGDFQLAIAVILLICLGLSALWTVMTRRLIYAVAGLAVTSAFVTILMFTMEAPLAGAFELSVCAGLIPAIFLSVISMVRKHTSQTLRAQALEQIRRFWLLPVIIVAVGIVLLLTRLPTPVAPAPLAPENAKKVLWNARSADLLGQITILLAGAFAVVVLLKGPRDE